MTVVVAVAIVAVAVVVTVVVTGRAESATVLVEILLILCLCVEFLRQHPASCSQWRPVCLFRRSSSGNTSSRPDSGTNSSRH